MGLEQSASEDEIRAAYRRLAKTLHPDVCSLPDAEAKFKILNQAHEVLTDRKLKKDYDASLMRPSRGSSSMGSSSGFGHWEVVFVDDEDDEEDVEFETWKSTGRNYRSSFQSSQQANKKKNGARRKAGKTVDIDGIDPLEILAALPLKYRVMAQNTFGDRLETLESLDELSDYLGIMEMIEEEEFDDEQDDLIEILMAQGRSSRNARPASNWQEGVGGRPSWGDFVSDFSQEPGRPKKKSSAKKAEPESNVDQKDDLLDLLDELMYGGPGKDAKKGRENSKRRPRRST